MAFHNGMNEYRLEKITSTQGHYPLAKNLTNALREAKSRANKSGTPWSVQLWKPTRGSRIYIILPTGMAIKDKKELVKHYKPNYDISHILQDKFVISRRTLY